MKNRHRLLFTFILLAALGLRLWLAPLRGHVHDVEQLKAWTESAVTNNPIAIYSTSTANYPPLGLLSLFGMGYLYRAFFSPGFDSSTTTLTALLKLPGIVADLVTAVVLFFYLARRFNRRWGWIGMAVYAFNPAVIYNTAWWGQLESLAALPMLLAVVALADGRIRWAWLWLAVAVLVKPQAAVIGPVILIGSLGAGGWRELVRGIGTAVITFTAVLLPFVLAGQFSALVAQIRASAGRQLFLTMNAHNFWYLITFGRGSFAAREGSPILDTEPLLGPINGWQVGLVLYLIWTLFICRQLMRGDIGNSRGFPVFWAAAAMVIGFYMLPAEAHERYLFPSLVLMVPLLPRRRLFQIIYVHFTITFFLNLFWVDAAVPVPAFSQNLALAIPLAALNVVFFIIFGCLMVDFSNLLGSMGNQGV